MLNPNHILSTPVLILNASFEPLHVSDAKRALKLIFKDAAFSIVDYDHEIRPGWPLPSVVKLKTYAHIPHKLVTCSRQGIMSRDENTCQYCGVVKSAKSLTLDHVIPKSRGGKANWSNLVCACKNCNLKKADRTPEEAGMKLLNVPREVTIHSSRHSVRKLGGQEPEWQKYLYYDNSVGSNLVHYN